MVKQVKDMVAEANAAVEVVTAAAAKNLVGRADVVFVDVRDAGELSAGKIAGAVHAARGLLEFVADPTTPIHQPELSSGKRLIVYCGSGGRSALAAKTLQDMGIEPVANLKGGFAAWVEAGGPTER